MSRLHDAVCAEAVDAVEEMIRKGADVNAPGEGGNSPLAFAAVSGNADMVTCLLDAGATVDWGGAPTSRTPLMEAATRGHYRAVELLLARGADANAMHELGTALHCAASKGDVGCVKLLLEHGADARAVSPKGAVTPLHAATCGRSTIVLRMLIDAGADVNAVAAQGESVMDWASEEPPEIAAFLDRHGAVRVKSASRSPVKPKDGCYVATACYGSYDHPDVIVLRRFRDQCLKTTSLGRGLITFYYRWSPAVARRMQHMDWASAMVRRALLAPLVRALRMRIDN